MRRRSAIVSRPWATGAPAIHTTGEWSAHKLPRRLGWPRWEGPERGSRNCVGGAAERHYADRKVGIARGSRLPHPFLWQEGRESPLGFRKNRSLEPMTLAFSLPLFDIVNPASKPRPIPGARASSPA